MRQICIGCGYPIRRYSVVKRYKGHLVHEKCPPKKPRNSGKFDADVFQDRGEEWTATIANIVTSDPDELFAFAQKVRDMAEYIAFKERLRTSKHGTC